VSAVSVYDASFQAIAFTLAELGISAQILAVLPDQVADGSGDVVDVMVVTWLMEPQAVNIQFLDENGNPITPEGVVTAPGVFTVVVPAVGGWTSAAVSAIDAKATVVKLIYVGAPNGEGVLGTAPPPPVPIGGPVPGA
jgi:hypothetical protein